MQKPPKLLEAQNVNKNKCLKNIFQKNFKPISWKENLFKKKKFGKIGNWCKMWHFWLFCNVWNCTERDEKYVHVWMILTRLLLKKVALGHSRGACLCHYSKMIFVFFMLEKTCQVSLTSVGFFGKVQLENWLSWVARVEPEFLAKATLLLIEQKKSHFTVVKNSWKCLISIFKRKFKFLKKKSQVLAPQFTYF